MSLQSATSDGCFDFLEVFDGPTRVRIIGGLTRIVLSPGLLQLALAAYAVFIIFVTCVWSIFICDVV